VHCKKTTHHSENCFEKFPAKLAKFRARRAAHGRGTGSTLREKFPAKLAKFRARRAARGRGTGSTLRGSVAAWLLLLHLQLLHRHLGFLT
jgi:hypothetical protein